MQNYILPRLKTSALQNTLEAHLQDRLIYPLNEKVSDKLQENSCKNKHLTKNLYTE